MQFFRIFVINHFIVCNVQHIQQSPEESHLV